MGTTTCRHLHHDRDDCPYEDGKVLGVNQHPNVLTGRFLPDDEPDDDEGSS